MEQKEKQQAMPLIEHLRELRKRLVYSLLFFFMAFLVCYGLAEDIYHFLAEPLERSLRAYTDQPRMIYTALWEVFFTEIKVAFFAALCISFPFLASQLWIFIAPGLYAQEKKVMVPYLLASPLLFFAGASLVYYVIFPLAWDFFLSFQNISSNQQLNIVLEAKVGEYLSLVMKLIFAFGFCFQLPIVLMLLTRLGIVTPETLAEKRKYAFVIILIFAALLTPPDVISQIGLALPIFLLYELSILCAKYAQNRKRSKE